MKTRVSLALCAVFLCIAAGLALNTQRSSRSPLISLQQSAIALLSDATETDPLPIAVATSSLYAYIEVVGSCGPYFQGECVNMRSGPGTEFPVVARLRNGIVLRVVETVDVEGAQWHKIAVEDTIRYPERVTSDWYVSGDIVALFYDTGDRNLEKDDVSTSTKRILVDRSDQMLYAYDGNTLFLETPISTGLEFTPTPRGTFTVFKMTPSRYMQGPIPEIGDDFFDLPGVPWNLYFTHEGAVIHGAYWHDHFGTPWSHGCVNLAPETAKLLYLWADLGMNVTVRD